MVEFLFNKTYKKLIKNLQNGKEPSEKEKVETGKKNNDLLFSAFQDRLKTSIFRNNATPLTIYLLQKIISDLLQFDFDFS